MCFALQMDMLDHFLAKFYQRRVQGTNEIYDISRDSKGLLLLYVLIVAVLAEDGEMSSETFESLRECLRMASTEVVSRLRYVSFRTFDYLCVTRFTLLKCLASLLNTPRDQV